jgi:hypothetical protein
MEKWEQITYGALMSNDWYLLIASGGAWTIDMDA